MLYMFICFALLLILCTILLKNKSENLSFKNLIISVVIDIVILLVFYSLTLLFDHVAIIQNFGLYRCVFSLLFSYSIIGAAIGFDSNETVYLSSIAFLMHEFTLNFSMMVNKYTLTKEIIEKTSLVNKQLFIVYTLILLFLLFTQNRASKSYNISQTLKKSIYVYTIIIITFSIIVSSRFLPRDINDMLFILLIMLELTFYVYIYVSQETETRVSMQLELDFNKKIYNLRENQYKIAVQNQEDLNTKCHDLKHYVRYLKNTNSQSDSVITDLEKTINAFDSMIDTGYPILDSFIMQEQSLCEHYGIEFHCMANGALLKNIEAVDLYVILGNIMDNAIEYVNQLSDSNYKIISLSIFKKNNFVVIKEENPLLNTPVMKGGLPATSKSDADNHGMGLRSVKSIVEKYNGTLSLQFDNNIYTVCILFP